MSATKTKLTDISDGYAVVRVVSVNQDGHGYDTSRRAGSVYRLNSGQWVPVTRSREAHATQPVFPRFATRQQAAAALASGEVVY